MVKTWHEIDAILSRIASANVRLVDLVPEAGDESNAVHSDAIDAATAAVEALATPLEYPPIELSTVPGDRVAIAVDSAVPGAAEVVRGVVDALHQAGVDDAQISIVTTTSDFGRRCRAGLDNGPKSPVQSVTHDPDDADNLCLVAVPKRREPLRVNRTIYDADVVLPISCARLDGCGAFDGLFPSFAGAEAVDRFRTPAGHRTADQHADMVRETDEAGWLIGVPLVVSVVPGRSDKVAHVVAGDPRAVARRSAELCHRRWALRSPRRASLVIATLGSSDASQTWNNVGRALATAEQLVNEGGAIALCTNLAERPGQSLGRLVGADDLSAAERKIAHDHAIDSWPAWQLARALQRGPVYLLSQLEAETVEDLGVAPVTDVDELIRLAGRHPDCIVIEDAHHAAVRVDDDEVNV